MATIKDTLMHYRINSTMSVTNTNRGTSWLKQLKISSGSTR